MHFYMLVVNLLCIIKCKDNIFYINILVYYMAKKF